jgi:hypothetical protein
MLIFISGKQTQMSGLSQPFNFFINYFKLAKVSFNQIGVN